MSTKDPILPNEFNSESGPPENDAKSAHHSPQNAPSDAPGASVQSVASSPGEGLGADKLTADGLTADKLKAPKPALERSEGKRGPKTPEGKARSSRNAVKHGIRSPHPFIIEGVESPEEWEELKLGIIESWQPVGMQELELAINIAWDHWNLRRCRFQQNAQLTKQAEEVEWELQHEDDDEDDDAGEEDDQDEGMPSSGAKGDVTEGIPLPEIDPERLLRHQHLHLIPDGWSVDRLLRIEAFVRKALSQDKHQLEVHQARRRGEHTPLARVVFNSDPSAAKVRHSASDIPEFQIARERVRLAELTLVERKRARLAEKATHA